MFCKRSLLTYIQYGGENKLPYNVVPVIGCKPTF